MPDDQDRNRSAPDTSEEEEAEEHREDWDPMFPETTPPASATDQAAREEERQLETGEENPT